MLLLSVPCGALGSGLRMPFFAMCITSRVVSHLREAVCGPYEADYSMAKVFTSSGRALMSSGRDLVAV